MELIQFWSPLGIGEDNSIRPSEEEVEGEIIKIFSPTDCVKDRLASYIHFKAEECLDQAIMVAERHPVNFKEIQKWYISEQAEKEWKNFLRLLKQRDSNAKENK